MEQKEKIINIYNPKDFPFGPLSNIAQHEIIVDSKRWPTVENYILSNMLITPLYRLALQIAPIKGKKSKENIEEKVKQMVARVQTLERRHVDRQEVENIRHNIAKETSIQKMDIKKLYQHYLKEEYINNLRTATEKAYNAKISENKDLENVLLQTDNRPILYVSDNDILGIGKEKNGLNFIGKILMQIRNRLRKKIIIQRKEENEKQVEDLILDSYRARVIIVKLLSSRNDLKTYIGKTAKQVIEYYLETHQNENLDTLGLGENIRNTVMEMFKRGQLPIVQKELESPGYMISAARRDKLRDLKERIEREKEDIILNAYTKNIIKQKYPLMSDEGIQKASEQLVLLAPSTEQFIKLRKRIVQMYLQGKIDMKIKELDELPKISEEDIKEAETIPITKEEEEKENSNSEDSDYNPIKQILHEDDSKTHKFLLIQKLQKYTGNSPKIYKDLSLDELRNKLEKYEKGSEEAKETAGEWVVKIKHRNNRIEIIDRTSGKKPSSEKIKEALEIYNKEHNTNIRETQVFVKWETKVPKETEKSVKLSEKTFIKYIGNPIEIYSTPEQNSPELKELSPLFVNTFSVDGYIYPSVAIYNTTILLTHTGIAMDVNNRTLNKRGMTIAKARNLLLKNNSFVTPDEANKIYIQLDIETHKKLEEIYARTAITKKFEDIGLCQLLALTGDAKLVYYDTDNIVLGIGTKEKKGLNIVGQILTEIRANILENTEKYFLDINIPNEVSNLLMSDSFLKSWVQMRVSDMCSVVAKMKKYLLEIGNQQEDISDRFVSFVIDLIYKQCSSSFSENKTPMPEEFINMIKSCDLFPEKLSRDFEKEIEEVKNEQDEYVNNFWKINITKETVKKEKLSGEKFSKLMEAFLNSSPPPSEEEIEKYKNSLLREFENDITSVKVRDSFDDKQRKEWLEFIPQVLKPVKSYEEIYSAMNKLKRKQQEQLRESSISDKIEIQKQQEKEREELWQELTQPAKSLEERNAEIAKFNKKQENDRLIHYGIFTEPKSKDDLNKYTDDMKKFTERIVRLKGRQKDELKHIQFIIGDVSQLFWNYISSMIQYVVDTNKKHTRQSVRETIVNSELVQSEKMTCQNIPINLSDSNDNCIASALANILSGIEKFKYQYAEDIPFGTHDINLATSIIIGREVKDEEPEKEEVHEEDKEEEQELSSEDEDNEREMDYEDAFEDDLFVEDGENIGFDNLEEELEQEIFGMKRLSEPNENIEQVRLILKEIVKKDIPNIDSLVKDFLKAIKKIKSSKLSEKIKINRINFFATIKV